MDQEKYNEEIEVRSTEVQEVLSFVPNWMIRWGITVFLITIVLLLTASWFIKYPQIIVSQVTVSPSNPAVGMVARSSGKIHFSVKEEQHVKKGDVLAYMENPGKTEDILLLRKFILKNNLDSLKPELFKGLDRNLGDIGPSYTAFRKALESYNEFQDRDYFAEKIQNLKKQVNYHRDLDLRLEKQEKIASDEFDLAQSAFTRATNLKDQGVVSESQWEVSKSDYLAAKNSLENTGINRLNNKIQISEIERRITDLEQDLAIRMRNVILDLDKARESLISAVSSWEYMYLMVAPVDGEIAFFRVWSDNQYIENGEKVLSIVPASDDIVGKIQLPITGAGKVEIGQKVNIKFAGYPFNEYGAVHGIIRRINPVQQNDFFMIDVSLPNGLTTTYGITIEGSRELQGTAEIITKDLRLIDRLFNQIRYIFTENV